MPGQKKTIGAPIAALFCALASSAWGETFSLTVIPENEDLFDQIESSSLSKAALEREDSDGADVAAAAKADYRRILEVLYANGRFDTQIGIKVNGTEAAALSPFEEYTTLPKIDVEVRSGPEFVFGRTEIDPVAPETELPEEFAPGAPARSGVVREAVAAGVAGWRDTGYPRAELSGQSLRARHQDSELDVDLDLEPGPRLRFGDVTVLGTERMDPERVRKIANVPAGEVFSPQELQDAQRRLVDTGVFRSVVVREDPENNPDGTVDVTAEVQEEKLRRIGGGAEVGSSDGLTVSGFWYHRNLLGGGERLRFDAEISRELEGEAGLEYRLGVSFRRPATPRPDTNMVINAEASREDKDDYTEDQLLAEILFDRTFSDHLTLASGLRFTATETDFQPGVSNFVNFGIPLQATYDRRDFETNAKEGYYLDAELFPFYGTQDSDSGLRFYLDSRFYESFGGDDRFTLALRGQLGYLFGVTTGEVPESYLFLSGGSGTVRGQPFESLGVETPNGTFGGTEFGAASFEVRYDLTDSFGVVGFYDIGYVGEEGDGDSHSGAGLGVRYNTPIGPLRFDLAGPLSGETNDGVQFYFGIGQAF